MSQSQAPDVKANSSELALVRAVSVTVDTHFLEHISQFLILSFLQTNFSCNLWFPQRPLVHLERTVSPRTASVVILLKPSWDTSLSSPLPWTNIASLLHLLSWEQGEIIIVSLQTRVKYLSSNVKRSKYGINYSNRFAQKRAIKLM